MRLGRRRAMLLDRGVSITATGGITSEDFVSATWVDDPAINVDDMVTNFGFVVPSAHAVVRDEMESFVNRFGTQGLNLDKVIT